MSQTIEPLVLCPICVAERARTSLDARGNSGAARVPCSRIVIAPVTVAGDRTDDAGERVHPEPAKGAGEQQAMMTRTDTAASARETV